MARSTKSVREIELERKISSLELEISKLKSKKQGSNFGQALKKILVVILVFLCALSLNFSIVAGWMKQNIVNTEVWTANTDAMLDDPVIRSNLSTRITNEIFDATDVESIVEEVVPPRAQALSIPLTNSLKSHTETRVNTILESEQFQTFWHNLNKSAHAGIISSLENGGQKPSQTDQYILYIDDNQLLLNLKPIVQKIQSELAQNGLSFVSSINTNQINKTVTLTEIESLPQILTAFEILNKSFRVLMGLAVVFGTLAVILATQKRKVLIGLSITTIVLMTLNVQMIYLSKYPLANQAASTMNSSTSTSAQSIFDILTGDLIYYNRILMLIATIVLVAAALSGQSKIAVGLRRQLSKLTSSRTDSAIIVHLKNNTSTYIAILAAVSISLIVFNPTNSVAIPLTFLIFSCLSSLWLLSIGQQATKTK